MPVMEINDIDDGSADDDDIENTVHQHKDQTPDNGRPGDSPDEECDEDEHERSSIMMSLTKSGGRMMSGSFDSDSAKFDDHTTCSWPPPTPYCASRCDCRHCADRFWRSAQTKSIS